MHPGEKDPRAILVSAMNINFNTDSLKHFIEDYQDWERRNKMMKNLMISQHDQIKKDEVGKIVHIWKA
jgi:hypothetical protein